MILSLRQRYGFYAINSQHVPWTQERYQSVRCLSKAISSARFTYCGAQFLVLARRREAVERSYVPSTACFVMCMGPTCAITKHRIGTAGASDQAFGTSPKPSTSHHVIATQKTESARLKSSIEGGTVLPLSFCAPAVAPITCPMAPPMVRGRAEVVAATRRCNSIRRGMPEVRVSADLYGVLHMAAVGHRFAQQGGHCAAVANPVTQTQ